MSEGLRLHRILDALAQLASTDRGAQLATGLAPAADPAEADRRLQEVAEAEILLRNNTIPAFPPRLILDALLGPATLGAILDGVDLVHFARLARVSRQLRRQANGWGEATPLLRGHAQQLPDLDLLASLLGDALDDDGRILDTASAELGQLRQEVLTLATRLRRRIEALVKETDDAGLLQDEYFTLRDDRYVLPVRASEKRTLGGIIHGASQTGHTVYVEPQELVEANNQLALAIEAVRREERRILAELSAMCAEHAPELTAASAILGALDLRLASARLAERLGAHRPQISRGDRLDAPALRHPLLVLDGVRVVPCHLQLAPPARWMVVSGPNGGGKTVVLSSLGLLIEMSRRGLFVCASADTVVPWFDDVEVVMGDAQDIERGLSTFEGHLRLVARALSAAAKLDRRTLLLLDELATGTEPIAAAALATAVLEHAASVGPTAWGAVSTHFEALKLLPLRDPRFSNAALELDAHTLTPTYRLTLGQIGTSNPLALAARIGLPQTLLDRAGHLLGTGGSQVAEMLDSLRQQRQALEKATAGVEHEKNQLVHSRTLLEDQRRNEQKAADRRIERATAEAMEELRQIGLEVGRMKEQLQQADRKKLEEAAKVVSARQVQVETLQRGAQERLQGKPQRQTLSSDALVPGTNAFHRGLDRVVRIIERKGERVKVNAGALEMWCPLGDLQSTSPAEAKAGEPHRKPEKRDTVQARQQADATQGPQSLEEGGLALRTAAATTDVRGMRVEEALSGVDQHIDRAILSGMVGVCIVHGLGTGALRDAVRSHLTRHPHVDRWRTGDRSEGGEGATLVWLRQ